MWNKLKKLIADTEGTDFSVLKKEEKKEYAEKLLIQIRFFQHERLVHLIVTVLFALLTFLNLFMVLYFERMALIVLEVLFIALLFPYVLHYYRLENGVQRLYELYEGLLK